MYPIVVLLFDGFPLAKRLGKPGLALASSFVSSFLGALVSTILFTFFALPIALKALEFGPAELFAVFVLSFATLIGLGAEAPMKSLAMLALGLLLAAATGKILSGILYEVSALDPIAFTAAPMLLAAAALIATWLPAHRAARLNPVEALRYE